VALALALAAAWGIGADAPAPASEKPKPDPFNGFEIKRQLVDRSEILRGGPPRDGIRRVDAPKFAAPDAATWVRPGDPVLGLVVAGDARAYPVHLIERHQIVNDRIGGKPVAVTYDPLTGAPIAFLREVEGRDLHFGVSGLIYNSGFLMYDRETQSLWSQFEGRAVAGELAGRTLSRLRVRQEDLGAWIQREPKTRVLERPEPDVIDYRFSPYEAYWVEDRAPFPVKGRDRRFHAKELVLGLVKDGKARAYLGSIATEQAGWIEDEFVGRKLQIDYSSDLGVFRWDVPDDVEVTEAYWFAWKAFHPDTEIWQDPGKVEGRAP
jgi:hypothetical protein